MRTITSVSLLAMIAPAFLNGAKPLSAALQKVQSSYVRTVMDSRTTKVVELGSVLVLQIDGVMANPIRSAEDRIGTCLVADKLDRTMALLRVP